MDYFQNVCAIVPSLNPDEKLIDVTRNLKKHFKYIIIVNDGSISEDYFNQVSDFCIVLKHCKNFGKGRAMKTALNYYMNNLSGICKGVVFADGDNQHTIEDISNCANEMLLHQNELVIGVRNFNAEYIPVKSRTGNKITSFVFKSLCGINVSDTQTGLRALSNDIILKLVDASGERFEYETNMLLITKDNEIPIYEVPIKTVYIDNNKTSHFNPLRDSISIYKVIIKFAWASLTSTAIDILAYTVLLVPFAFLSGKYQILTATVIARIISSLFNFSANKHFVFGNRGLANKSLAKYYTLCVLQMICSWLLVTLLWDWLAINKVLAKFIVDIALFFISFPIQREWVFKNNKGK